MINLKDIDKKDLVFINKKLTEKEEKDFSDFLKKKKEKRIKITNKKSKTKA